MLRRHELPMSQIIAQCDRQSVTTSSGVAASDFFKKVSSIGHGFSYRSYFTVRSSRNTASRHKAPKRGRFSARSTCFGRRRNDGWVQPSHPSLSIRVVVAPWRELPGRLRDRHVDVVVGSSSEIEQLDEFEILALAAHDTVVVGRLGHPLTIADDVALGDIFRFPLAGPGMDSDAAELLAGLAAAVTGAPSSPLGGELLTIECDSSDVLKRVLMESDALSIMPRFIVADDLACRRLAVVTGVTSMLRVQFGAAWLRARTLSAVGTAFLEVMRAQDQEGSRA